MPTTASSPPTTTYFLPAIQFLPVFDTAMRSIGVGPIQGRRIALDQRRSTAGANSTTGPTAGDALCWKSVRRRRDWKATTSSRRREEIGAAKPGEYTGAAAEITVRLAVCDHKARQGVSMDRRAREVDWTDTADCDDRRVHFGRGSRRRNAEFQPRGARSCRQAQSTHEAGSKSAPLLTHQLPETTTQNRSVV